MSTLKNIFSTFISFVAYFKMRSLGYTGVEAFVAAVTAFSVTELTLNWIIENSRKLHIIK